MKGKECDFCFFLLRTIRKQKKTQLEPTKQNPIDDDYPEALITLYLIKTDSSSYYCICISSVLKERSGWMGCPLCLSTCSCVQFLLEALLLCVAPSTVYWLKYSGWQGSDPILGGSTETIAFQMDVFLSGTLHSCSNCCAKTVGGLTTGKSWAGLSASRSLNGECC